MLRSIRSSLRQSPVNDRCSVIPTRRTPSTEALPWWRGPVGFVTGAHRISAHQDDAANSRQARRIETIKVDAGAHRRTLRVVDIPGESAVAGACGNGQG